MGRVFIFLFLFAAYCTYTLIVYSAGTRNTVVLHEPLPAGIIAGKKIYETYNCTSCHQLYGLGGYLGPELTTAYSDPKRGPQYMKAFLMAGGPRMPNFHFSETQVNDLISYFRYVDSTAVTYKRPSK